MIGKLLLKIDAPSSLKNMSKKLPLKIATHAPFKINAKKLQHLQSDP
jgi:hypothetical protein